ncbi:MAG: hypothetical protein GY738_27265 [Pseudoalteromonas sp.]|nr:hypothetical protein [Pseudoalteromonas sp.]
MLPKRFESGYKSSNTFSQMSDLVVLRPAGDNPKEKNRRSNRRRSSSESSYTVSLDDDGVFHLEQFLFNFSRKAASAAAATRKEILRIRVW